MGQFFHFFSFEMLASSVNIAALFAIEGVVVAKMTGDRWMVGSSGLLADIKYACIHAHSTNKSSIDESVWMC